MDNRPTDPPPAPTFETSPHMGDAIREAELFLASYDAAIEDPEQDPALVAQQDAMPLAESLRSVLAALSTPPAADVREAAESAAEERYPMNVDTTGWSYEDAAEYQGRYEGFVEGFTAAAEVRPRGTVTDAPNHMNGSAS